MEEKSSGEESDQRCFMVQGNDSLEVYSETQLDNSVSSSCGDYIDAHTLYEKPSIVSEKLQSKYKVLKNKNSKLKEKKIKTCFLRLIWFCKKRMRFQMKGTH